MKNDYKKNDFYVKKDENGRLSTLFWTISMRTS